MNHRALAEFDSAFVGFDDKMSLIEDASSSVIHGISRVMEPRIVVRSKRFVEVDGSRTSASLMPRLRSNRTRNRAPVSSLAATSLPKGFSIITFIYVNGFIAPFFITIRVSLPVRCNVCLPCPLSYSRSITKRIRKAYNKFFKRISRQIRQRGTGRAAANLFLFLKICIFRDA